jgi:hypothetical protein
MREVERMQKFLLLFIPLLLFTASPYKNCYHMIHFSLHFVQFFFFFFLSSFLPIILPALYKTQLRSNLPSYVGFEANGNPEIFLAAFTTLEDAMGWAVENQLRLLEVGWPAGLQSYSRFFFVFVFF